jgi:hypothetical protein
MSARSALSSASASAKASIQADDVGELVLERRIVGDLEGVHQMRFQPACFPDPLHSVPADTGMLGPRNVIERGFNTVKQWRGLATRYDKLAIVYRGAATLRAITIWLPDLSDTP